MTGDKTAGRQRPTGVVVRRTLVGVTVTLAAAACLGGGPPADRQPLTATAALTAPTPAAAARSVVQAAKTAQRHDPIPADLHPPLAGLAHDRADVGACDYAVSTHRLCRRGASKSHRVIVVLGDSHSRVWIPAVQEIAGRTHYAAYYLSKPGCTSALVTPANAGKPRARCVDWRRWAIGQVRRMQPAVLILASALPKAVIGQRGRVVRDPARVAPLIRAGFVATVKRAQDAGVDRIYLIEDAPALDQKPGACLAAAGADLGTCASPPSAAADLMSQAEQAAARATGVRYVRTRPWFCTVDLCPAVVGTTITHRDNGHITTVYARRLSRALQQTMGLHKPSGPQRG
jgi:hypothetical protein